VDGTLTPIDRVAADRPFYSGKHKKLAKAIHVLQIRENKRARVLRHLAGEGAGDGGGAAGDAQPLVDVFQVGAHG
jgi:hypothetical protein